MKIDVKGVKLNLEYPKEIDKTKDYVLFLHGFTGCAEDWLSVIEQMPAKYNYIALDIVGHGKSDAPGDPAHYNIESLLYRKLFFRTGIIR